MLNYQRVSPLVKQPEGSGLRSRKAHFKPQSSTFQLCRGWASLCSSSWVLATLGETSKELGFQQVTVKGWTTGLVETINLMDHGWRQVAIATMAWIVDTSLGICAALLQDFLYLSILILKHDPNYVPGIKHDNGKIPYKRDLFHGTIIYTRGDFPALFDEGNPGSIGSGIVHIPSDSHTWQWEFPLLTGTSYINRFDGDG